MSGISYGDARAGNVKYIADGFELTEDDALPVTISATLGASSAVSGSDVLIIAKIPPLLTLHIPAQEEIWPTLPENQGGNPGNRNMKDSISITLTQNDQPIENQNVTVTARIILPSLPLGGGHDHTNQPLQDSLGVFRNLNMLASSRGMITSFTDENGQLRVSYRSPFFGGQIELTALAVIDDDTLVARDTLLVRVPGLQLLGNGTNYIKIGGTCNHHGPRHDGAYLSCRNPDNNHFGTVNLIRNIQAIADSFAVTYPNHQIQINDMSLALGGGFDIYGNWDRDIDTSGQMAPCLQAGFGHCRHRLGRNADIGFRVINPQGEDIVTTSQQRLRLLRIIIEIAGNPTRHTDHYHLQ